MPISSTDSMKMIDPSSPLVASVLAATYPSVGGMRILMTNEGDGAITISSIEQRVISTLEEALLALWKVSFCIEESWPYETWDSQKTNLVKKSHFSRHHRNWAKDLPRSQMQFVQGLKSLAHRVIENYLLAEPTETTCFLPNWTSVVASKLHELEYVKCNALCMILFDDWNLYQGLFKHRKRWFLVTWETYA